MAHPRLYENSSLDLHAFLRAVPPEPALLPAGAQHPRRAVPARSTTPRPRPATDTSSLFARFPHLARMELMWGSQECRDFVSRLIMDTRGGTRQGFPAEHASTIFRLLQEHDARFPEFEPAVVQTWGFGTPR